MVIVFGGLTEEDLVIIRQVKTECEICITCLFQNQDQDQDQEFNERPAISATLSETDKASLTALKVDAVFMPGPSESPSSSPGVGSGSVSVRVLGLCQTGLMPATSGTLWVKMFHLVRPHRVYLGQLQALHRVDYTLIPT